MTLATDGLFNCKAYKYTYADATARAAATGFTAAEVGTLALQLDNATLWILSDDSPVTWVAAAGSGMANPMTTAGDLILGGSSGTPGRLAKGADSTVLTIDPGTHLPVWAAPATAGPSGRLGSASATSNQATSSTSIGDISGLSAAVTVGSRRVKVTFAWADVLHSVTNGYGSLEIWDSTAGARLAQAVVIAHAAAGGGVIGPGGSICVEHNPGAGARTYKARFKTITAGTLTLEAGSDAPLTLLVEEI